MSQTALDPTPQSPSHRSAVASAALPRKDIKTSLLSLLGWAVAIGLLTWSWDGAEMRPGDLIAFAPNMAEFASGFTSPDSHHWRYFLSEMC